MKDSQIEYKPVVIGNGVLPEELHNGLLVSNMNGVNIRTDSEEMHRCLQLSGAIAEQSPVANTNFYYLTRSQLPFANHEGKRLEQIQVEYPGDIYMSPDMTNFYFWGIDKLGTLVSMVYGIRAIKGIKEGKLGLHSALLYDRDKQCTHLVVGRNRIGKSSIGQAIEDIGSRFIMLSDDWNEVDINNGTVQPMSIIFSPQTPASLYESAFQSFGKPFYHKHGIRPYPLLPLGSIIELYGSDEEMVDGRFVQRSMAHIPLLSQPIIYQIFDKPEEFSQTDIERFLAFQQLFNQGYQFLRSRHSTIQIKNSKGNNTLDDVVQQVLLNISQ